MKIKCLICGKRCDNSRVLGGHVKEHGLKIIEYKEMFGLIRCCEVCGQRISRQCKKGKCKSCCDFSGKNNPFYGKRHSRKTIDAIRKTASRKSKELWKDPSYRNKVIRGISKPRREGFKKEQSERVKEWYRNNPEQRDIRSHNMRKSWREGKISPSIHSHCESKKERKMRADIRNASPECRVEKKTIKVGKKWYLPDVVIDDVLIVEFFGNFWHANPKQFNMDDVIHHGTTAGEIWEKDRRRILELESAGYDVVVVWEDEYDNGCDVMGMVRMAGEQKKSWEKK